MRTRLRALGLLFLCIGVSGPVPATAADAASLWVKRFGASFSGQRVATDPSGNVVAAGHFSDSTGFGGDPLISAGSTDIYLASFDPSGAHRWSRRLGGTSSDTLSSIATDPAGNIVVTGSFEGTVDFGGGPLTSVGASDIYLASYAPSGAHRWSKRFGDAQGEIAGGVATDLGGNVVLTGFGGSLDLGGGPIAGGFLVSLDASGAHRWSRSLGGSARSHVAIDPNGNIAVGGTLFGSADFGGGPLTSAGSLDVFVASYTDAGAHRWSKRFGSTLSDQPTDVATDPGGGTIVTGQFVGQIGFGGGALFSGQGNAMFVASFDLSGTHRWSTALGGTWDQTRQGVATDPGGNVVVTGSFTGSTTDCTGAPTGGRMFVISYDPTGGHRWSRRFGDGTSQAFGTDVGTDAGGNVVVTGFAGDAVDFGGGPSSGGGGVVFAFRQDDIAPSSALIAPPPIATDPVLSTGTVDGVTSDSFAGVECVSVSLRSLMPLGGSATSPQTPTLACDALRLRCTWSIEVPTWPAGPLLPGLYEVVVEARDRFTNAASSVVGTVLLL